MANVDDQDTWTPPDEETIYAVTKTVAAGLVRGDSKPEIVNALTTGHGWLREVATEFVEAVDKDRPRSQEPEDDTAVTELGGELRKSRARGRYMVWLGAILMAVGGFFAFVMGTQSLGAPLIMVAGLGNLLFGIARLRNTDGKR